MQIQYILTAIIFFGCSCEDASVTGFVVMGGIARPASDLPPVLSETSPVDGSNNSSATERVIEKSELLFQPRMLIPQKPVDDNVNELDTSQQPQVLPIAVSINATDTGTAIQDNDETVSASDVSEVSSENSSTTEAVIEKSELLFQPRILIPLEPVNDNVNELDASEQPQVLPIAISINATVTGTAIQDNDETVSASDVPEVSSENPSTTEAVIDKSELLFQPHILIPPKPVNDNVNESDSSPQPQIFPVATSINATDQNATLDPNLNVCAHRLCPRIACQNNLPAIPSQGICCLRCVPNQICNTAACPKYKCGTYLIPANLTAGECCDRCAPASVKPTTTTKKPNTKPTKVTSRPKKNTGKPKKTTPLFSLSSSSSEAEQEEDSSISSSSEQHVGKPLGCNIRPFNRKRNRSRSHSRRRDDYSDE